MIRKVTMDFEIEVPEGAQFSSLELKDGKAILHFEKSKDELGKIHTEASRYEVFWNPEEFNLEDAWFKHTPATKEQAKLKDLFLSAREENHLHPFTFMTIDPCLTNLMGEMICYKKNGIPILKSGEIMETWTDLLELYWPERKSRMMTRTEYVCRTLCLIKRMVDKGILVDNAWRLVCDNSQAIGNYKEEGVPWTYLQNTGSRECVGFYDLANTAKLLVADPWDKRNRYWLASGSASDGGSEKPVAQIRRVEQLSYYGPFSLGYVVGMIAMD